MRRRLMVVINALLIIALQLGPLPVLADVPVDPHEIQRSCFGWLWCRETSSEGVATDALFYLYSAETRGPYSRWALRPLYSEVQDPTKDLLRRSILWPLGSYERNGRHVASWVAPLYWHGEDPELDRSYTLALPFYLSYTHADQTYLYLVPFFGQHLRGDYYRQRYYLGPLLITTEDQRRQLARWEVLFPLARYQREPNKTVSWFLPFYAAGHDATDGRDWRFVIPLYGHYARGDSYRWRLFLGPLLVTSEDTERQSAHWYVLFPLGGHLRERDSSTTWAAPLYFAGHDATDGREWRLVLPLYGSIIYPTWSYRFASLLWGTEQDQQSRTSRRWGLGLPPVPRASHFPTLALYEQTMSGDRLSNRVFPFYWYASDATGTQLDAVFLYRHRTGKDGTRDRFFPLYDYDRNEQGTGFSAFGASTLALYRLESTTRQFRHRLFPLYRYEHNLVTDKTGFGALLVYWHHRDASRTEDRFLPLWDYRDADEDHGWRIGFLGVAPWTLAQYRFTDTLTAHRLVPLYAYTRDGATVQLNALGLPSLGRLPALSLYEYEDSPTRTAHRVTPLYAYAYERAAETTSANALGLWWYERTPEASRHSVALLESYRYDKAADEWSVSSLGLDPLMPVSLVRFTASPDRARGLLFPIIDYRRTANNSSLSLGGVSRLALFRREQSETRMHHHLFPLYVYEEDLAARSSWLNLLLLVHHAQSPTTRRAWVLPFGSYTYDRATGKHLINGLGIGSWSLFVHRGGETRTEQRLVPFYRYVSDRAAGTADLSVLWPLVEYKRRTAESREVSVFWWLAQYERSAADARVYRLLGGSRMAFLRWETSSERTRFEINPVIPLYSYASEPEGRASWDLLGGLIGRQASREDSRWRVLWFF